MLFKRHFLNVILVAIVILAALSILLAAGVVTVEGIWLVFPGSNLRISTFLTALVSFLLVLFLQKRILWKPLYYAALAVVFFLGLYEIVWYYLAAAAFGYDLRIFQFAALAGWVLLCIREVYPHKPPKSSLVLYGVFVAAMVLWVASGFAVNNLGDAQFSVTGEVFNVASKAALALAFAIHIGTKH